MAIGMGAAILGAAGVGAGASVGGSIGSAFFARKAATKARRAQRRMYKNRYRWTMDDLEQAGLNPILAAGGAQVGGAASPIKADVPMDMGSRAVQAAAAGASTAVAWQQARKLKLEADRLEPQATLAGVKDKVLEAVLSPVATAVALKKVLSEKQKVDMYKYEKKSSGLSPMKWKPHPGRYRKGVSTKKYQPKRKPDWQAGKRAWRRREAEKIWQEGIYYD